MYIYTNWIAEIESFSPTDSDPYLIFPRVFDESFLKMDDAQCKLCNITCVLFTLMFYEYFKSFGKKRYI